MTIRRLILVSFLTLLLLVIAVMVYLHYVNFNQYRNQIASSITSLTGRDVTIGEVGIKLWPIFSVQTHDVLVANASWGTETYMAKIGNLSTSIRPISLLFGPVLVQDFTLENVSFLFEVDKQGKSNWDLTKDHVESQVDEKKDSGKQHGLPVMLSDVKISNIAITRRQSEIPDQNFHLDKLDIHVDEADKLDLSGSGKVLDLPLRLKGQVGTREQLNKTGDAEVSLTGSLAGLQMDITGQLAITNIEANTHLRAIISSDDVSTFFKAADLAIPLSGPLKVKADFTSNKDGHAVMVDGSLGEFNSVVKLDMRQGNINIDGKLNHSDKLGAMLGIADIPKGEIAIKGILDVADQVFKVKNIAVTSGKAQVSASGTLATGNNGATSLQVKAVGESLADLMTNLPPLAFNGTADLMLSQREVKVDPLQLRVGASDIKGSVVVVKAKPGAVKADIVATTLDLTEFTHNEKGNEVGEHDTAQVPAAMATPGKAESVDSKYYFTDEPLPFDLLQRSGLNVTLKAGKLISPAITLNDVRATGALHKGELTADIYFKTPRGGRSVIDIVLNSSNKQSTLHAKLEGRDLRLKVISGGQSTSKDNPTINISADLKSSGRSPRALAANSNGNVLVVVGPGEMNNTIINRVAGDIIAKLISALNPFTKAEEKSYLECGVMNADIVDGLSKVDTLMIQDKKVLIVAGGTLDLKTEKINFEFNTKPRTGVGISADMFVTPFVGLGGTLKKPSVELKKTGTLLTLGAAFFTGGLSLALQGGVDRVSGAVDQCAVALPKYPLPPLEDD